MKQAVSLLAIILALLPHGFVAHSGESSDYSVELLQLIRDRDELLLLGQFGQDTLDQEWRQFKLEYAKSYASQLEEYYRRLVWESSYLRVLRHNHDEASRSGVRSGSFTLGMNQFADLTSQEFAKLALSKKPLRSLAQEGPRVPLRVIGRATSVRDSADPPRSIDWRLKGCVSPVKSQTLDSSSSVYGVVGSAEGQICSVYSKSNHQWLSNQQVIDCANATLTPTDVYAYLASNQGRLDTGLQGGPCFYRETGVKGPCAFKPNCTAAIVSGFVDLPSGSEAALLAAVATAGPVTVVVDASRPSFQLYKSGVYNDPKCSSSSLDHVMLVVGYGVTRSGEPYWVVKNSWGTAWGKGGYVLMSRDRGNQCGIASMASYALARPVD